MKNSIAYIGMDVHKNSYTLCTFLVEEEKVLYKTKITASVEEIQKYVKYVKEETGKKEVICGYEAGCLGYSLKKLLDKKEIKCVILAPTTMLQYGNKRVKTDKKDAESIAKNLAYHTYKEVQMVKEEDEEIKEYIRMRDDHKLALTKIKQQINAFVLRQGEAYDGSKTKWTQAHIKWLKELKLREGFREVLDEYMVTYNQLSDKIDRYDKKIEEKSKEKKYQERVKKLECFIGIKTITAMTIITEIGDIARFGTAQQFSSFIGLVPGEQSSGDATRRLSITKAGNKHIRKLLIESAHCYNRGYINKKSKELIKRQEGNKIEVIAYADKANERLKRKFRQGIKNGKKYNVIATAIARELTCFIWGMLKDKIA